MPCHAIRKVQCGLESRREVKCLECSISPLLHRSASSKALHGQRKSVKTFRTLILLCWVQIYTSDRIQVSRLSRKVFFTCLPNWRQLRLIFRHHLPHRSKPLARVALGPRLHSPRHMGSAESARGSSPNDPSDLADVILSILSAAYIIHLTQSHADRMKPPNFFC